MIDDELKVYFELLLPCKTPPAEGAGAKGNKADRGDRVLAQTSVKEASVEFAAAAAERATIAPVVPVDRVQPEFVFPPNCICWVFRVLNHEKIMKHFKEIIGCTDAGCAIVAKTEYLISLLLLSRDENAF
jgi:hypothetical protein